MQITALKNLGLNIRKAKVLTGGRQVNTFYITDAETSEKILKSARLEEIRLTIINNMLYYHPVSLLSRLLCKAGMLRSAGMPASLSCSAWTMSYMAQAGLHSLQLDLSVC
jgi:hypothetical protein